MTGLARVVPRILLVVPSAPQCLRHSLHISRRRAARSMKKSTQRRPTMTDIAKSTGVSQSTVSLVLNNATGAKFSEATRTRVLRAAHDLGYRLSSREPVPASKDERRLIVYLADEISTSPH